MNKLLFLVSFFSLQVFILNQEDKQIMDKDQFVKYLIELANRETEYISIDPFNRLFLSGFTWSTDNINLLKALFNGRDIYDDIPSSYQRNYYNTGDINAEQMIRDCSDVSSDFTRLKEGEPRVLYFQDHVGAYLGKTVVTNYGLCNVVEATREYDLGDGIIFTWVDPDGTRRNKKNGFSYGKWTEHGLPSKWVSY